MTEQQVIQQTKKWLWTFIIELNLCPFARKEWVNQRIHYSVLMNPQEEALTQRLWDECERLDQRPDIATTLVIFPNALQSFEQYNQFLDIADNLIEQGGWLGVYQVASFHPDYQFADTHSDDVENFTNRSIFPMLHILREADVEQAVAHHPDPDGIPEGNIRLMNEMGIEKILALHQQCREIEDQK
jgi:hypothetical protein